MTGGYERQARVLLDTLDEAEGAALTALAENAPILADAGFVQLPRLVALDILRIKTAALHRFEGGEL
jgi:hypothetical protein